MFEQFRNDFRREFSGHAAKRNVLEVSRFDRGVWAGPGLQAVADWCVRKWAHDGIHATREDHPADGRTMFLASVAPREWDCDRADLWIVEPQSFAQRLCSYHENRLHLATCSAPTPSGGVTAEVVWVEHADDDAAFSNIDVRGKIVLTSVPIEDAKHFAVRKYGALGLITDFMPELPNRKRWDLPDELVWQFFENVDDSTWAFVLTPRQGEELRRIIARANAAGHPLIVRATVESRFFVGTLPTVHAVIPGSGQTDEEVLVLTNTCHPQGFANNSASGVGLLLEMARALQRLIETGTIPRPRRSIRFLLGPEMIGTYAYLARHEEDIPRLVAGINPCTVGGYQETALGPFIIEDAHRSVPSFGSDLLQHIIDEDATEFVNYGGTFPYSRFRLIVAPYSGAGDAAILSEPTVNVPTPVMLQWPEKHYHTPTDSIEHMDPDVLTKNATVAATYVHFIANATSADAIWLADEMESNFIRRIKWLSRRALSELHDQGDPRIRRQGYERHRRRFQFELDRRLADFSAARRLCGAETQEFDQRAGLIAERLTTFCREEANRFTNNASAFLPDWPPGEPVLEDDPDLVDRAARLVPARLYRGRIDPRLLSFRLNGLSLEANSEFRLFMKRRELMQRTASGVPGRHSVYWTRGIPTRALAEQTSYWMDGQRTVLEICDLLEVDTGTRDLPFVIGYAEWLARMDLIELRSRQPVVTR